MSASVKRTRIKFCGLMRSDDALAAAALGVDAIGLIFAESSRRCLTVTTAQAIAGALPPLITRVGLFKDSEAESVRAVLAAVELDLLQFHGDEAPEFCDQFALPYIKALRIKEGVDLLEYSNRYQNAKALLLDTYSANMPGGTGEVFDWKLIPSNLPLLHVLNLACVV